MATLGYQGAQTMISVLFVDDEAPVLERLQTRLRALRDRWDMRFAGDADEAVKIMGTVSVDALVTDMLTPAADGLKLLGAARQRFPGVIRFLLMDAESEQSAVGAIPVAHQILKKNFDTAVLERAIDRISGLQNRRRHPIVAKTLGMVNSLPSLPQLYWDLVRAIDDPRSGTAEVAAIVERDMAMTARLLQLANASIFGGGRAVRSVKDAVDRVGMDPIRSAVLSLHFFRGMSGNEVPAGFSIDQLQAESWEAARLANEMVRDVEMRKCAVSACVLSNIGRLVLACNAPDDFMRVTREARSSGRAEHSIEQSLLGCDHAEIGAQLLALWGLPASLVEAVAYHHRPSISGERSFGAVGAAHVASAMIGERQIDNPAQADAEYDEQYLRAVGMSETVSRWRKGDPLVPV
jgi:HD-like signal output (HDOD) protein